MTTKHTPGPWKVGPSREYQVTADGLSAIAFECIDIDAGSGEAIGMAACDYVLDGEAEANARLIAAAPDLLSLLIELTDIEGPQPGTATWAKKVEAAIAKATGKEAP